MLGFALQSIQIREQTLFDPEDFDPDLLHARAELNVSHNPAQGLGK